RRLLRTVRSGALATLTPEGAPYASLVTVATLPDGSPVLPLSTLAVHTQHLMADPRCSLLLDSAGQGDPLTHPRLTVTACAVKASPEERAAWRSRFLRRHPEAGIYVDFGDFSFWRLELGGARIIGGFGRIAMLEASDLLIGTDGAEALIAAEDRSIDHMNADHRDALKLYATALCGAAEGDWRLVGLDPEGIDLGWQGTTLRLEFPDRVTDSTALRRQLVRWVDEAKAKTNPA
ncbi:MAG: HugZ family protein, partial [Janthinobacterium lividum]